MRLFVAINPSAFERERIGGIASELRGQTSEVRWVASDDYHLTLFFLGEVLEDRLPDIEAAMRVAVRGERPFDLETGGFGVVPGDGDPRVLWIEIREQPSLRRIQVRLARQLEVRGFRTETRRFRPHLTLGRVGKGVRCESLEGLLSSAGELEFSGHPIAVRTLDLVQSEARRGAARYRVISRAPLLEAQP